MREGPLERGGEEQARPIILPDFRRSLLARGACNLLWPLYPKIMQEILFGYKLNPTTWAYISTLMMIGIYFKFHRFWSVRNLDLVALVCFSPALLLIYYGLSTPRPELVQAGYVWLFAVSAFLLIRLLLDPVMVRRPLLEPNLSASGLTFTGISLLIFLDGQRHHTSAGAVGVADGPTARVSDTRSGLPALRQVFRPLQTIYR